MVNWTAGASASPMTIRPLLRIYILVRKWRYSSSVGIVAGWMTKTAANMSLVAFLLKILHYTPTIRYKISSKFRDMITGDQN